MKEKFIENRLEYIRCGDYYIPNLELPENKYEIGKYGRMRETYLKKEKHWLYSSLLMKGKLNEHLHDVDEQAREILDQFIKQAEHTAPDKATQQMKWVAHMNSAKASAEEIIYQEIIYI